MKKHLLTLLAALVLLVGVFALTTTANAEEVCPHCNQAMSAITWLDWDGEAGNRSTTGHYRLTGPYTQNGQVKFTGGDTVLDLAGQTLSTTTNRPFYVNGGKLTILDTSEEKTGLVTGKATASGAVLFVNTNGTLDIYGGTYESAATTGSKGGTISINGNVTLHDGVIKGSTSTSTGGCLHMEKGSFTMEGGRLTAGNAGTSGGTVFAQGGTLNLSGGVIESGTVGSGKSGTAVFAYRAAEATPCTVNIGSVEIPAAEKNSTVIGGNVTLGISGAPKIGYMSINATSVPIVGEMEDGASVYLAISGSLPLAMKNDQMETYLAKGYFKSYGVGTVLTTDGASLTTAAYTCPCCGEENVKWTAWGSEIVDGTHYYLEKDLELTAQINIPKDISVTLDLCGREITSAATRAFIVYGNLDIVDSKGGSKVTTGTAATNGGVFSVQATGNLELFGGTYTAQAAPTYGSVAYVIGKMTIHDAVTLDGTNAQDMDKVGSTVYTKGSFHMDGGEIIGATAKHGGSVYVETGALNVTGGTISGGQISSGGYGKEIYISTATEVLFSDCVIADQVQINKADAITVSGAAQLGQLKLSSSVRLTLGQLQAPACIPVVADGEFTIANENASAYLQAGYIQSGKANMEVVVQDDVLVMQGLPGVKCPHCGSATVAWTVWTPDAAAAGHYYLEDDAVLTKEFSVSKDMVIDLRGCDITATAARVFNVKSGTLTVVDTQGGAVVTGGQTGNGGVLYVGAGGTLELVGGKYIAGAKAAKGGVAYVPAGGKLKIRNGAILDGNGKTCSPIYVGGFVYMYGGEVKGSSAALGGSVHIYDTGYFELSGGKIYGGSGTSLTSAYALGGDNVYVQGGTMVMSGGIIEAEDSTHLGTAILATENASLTIAGTADAQGLSGKVLLDSSCTFDALLGAGAINSLGRTTWFNTNAKALDSKNVMVKLYSDEPVDLTGDAMVDLNGHKVAFSGNYKLSAVDSTATTQKAGTGEATVEGPVADCVAYDGDRFYAVTQDGKTTFHRLQMKISAVSLRAKEAGIYYKSTIACDPVLADKITSYGVALSVKSMPGEDFAQADSGCMYTRIETDNFVGGCYTSGIVKGILKAGLKDNAQRGEIDIYANPYIYLDGELVMGQSGDTAKQNLKQVMQMVNRIYPTLETAQTDGVKAMAEKFADVAENWDLHNIQADLAGNYEVKRLKVLTLGHSLAVDAGRMLAYVGYAEGAVDITVGTLYYSGCTLSQHANYLNYNIPCYDMYYSNLATADRAPVVTKGVTMAEGLCWDDWDIIVMQAGVFEAGRPGEYDGDIQTIIDYINANKTNPDAKLMWNMTWAAPKEESGLLNDSYKSNFNTYFDMDQLKMHGAICDAVQTKILTNAAFEGVIPTGTAIQNANSSYLNDTDLYRDYIHVTDLGRVIAAYTWYCRLTGREVTELEMDTVPGFLRFNAADQTTDLVLSDAQKNIVLESVRNALANPYEVTQSVYTTK